MVQWLGPLPQELKVVGSSPLLSLLVSLVSESGYSTMPVTLSIDNSDRHPYLCLEILRPTVMLKNITKVESIVELGHETEWSGNRNV